MAAAVLDRRAALGLMGVASSSVAMAGWAAVDPSSPSPVPAPLRQSRADRALTIISPALLEQDAQAAMPEGAFAYVHGAAGDDWTLARNSERLRALALRPHRLVGFSAADTSATLLGRRVPAPLYVCPMGAQDIVHADAELASVRGAAAAQIPYMLSSASNKSLEQVAAAAPDALKLFALYLNQDWTVNRALARRARAAGFAAIVMTVDSLGPGASERYRQLGSPTSAQAGEGDYDAARGGIGNPQALKKDFAPADIGRLREACGLPVIVKGVLRPEDAERSVAAGAAAVVVSNHGGRTLDGAPAAIDALGPIVHAVRSRVPVYFDSGVRRGADIVRALALGANAVGIGRPVLDALALGGAPGVTDLLNWFQADLATTMLLIGARRCSDISGEFLFVDLSRPGVTGARRHGADTVPISGNGR